MKVACSVESYFRIYHVDGRLCVCVSYHVMKRWHQDALWDVGEPVVSKVDASIDTECRLICRDKLKNWRFINKISKRHEGQVCRDGKAGKDQVGQVHVQTQNCEQKHMGTLHKPV